MSLQFDISPDHELYRYFALYGSVEYDGQRYLINGINERKTVSTITCELDLTGLNYNVYPTYNKSTVSFASVCSEILKGTGWTVVDADLVAARRTLELTDVTTLDISIIAKTRRRITLAIVLTQLTRLFTASSRTTTPSRQALTLPMSLI